MWQPLHRRLRPTARLPSMRFVSLCEQPRGAGATWQGAASQRQATCGVSAGALFLVAVLISFVSGRFGPSAAGSVRGRRRPLPRGDKPPPHRAPVVAAGLPHLQRHELLRELFIRFQSPAHLPSSRLDARAGRRARGTFYSPSFFQCSFLTLLFRIFLSFGFFPP